MGDSDNTRLGSSAHVTGALVSEGDLHIEGRIDGPVSTSGDITVAEGGTVVGDVTGRDVHLDGRVEGSVLAAGQLEIGGAGVLLGNIRAAGLNIHDGGRFRGQVSMNAAFGSEDGEDSMDAPAEVEGHETLPPLPDDVDDDEPPAWDTDEHRAAEARARVESAYGDTTGSGTTPVPAQDDDAPPRRNSIDQLGITRRQPGERPSGAED